MKKIKVKLKELADEKYKKFSSSLIPNETTMLGVRLPLLRSIAKEIAKENYTDFLNETPEYFEERMLQGMVIGEIKESPKEILKHIKAFVPKINSWSVCDSFCMSLKFVKKNKPLFFDFIKQYATSNKEFEIRFFLVSMLCYFVEKEYLSEIFAYLNKINLKDYYAKMGAAWLIAECYIKFKEETALFLKENNLDFEVQNKAIQKIKDSYRVSAKDKAIAQTFAKTR